MKVSLAMVLVAILPAFAQAVIVIDPVTRNGSFESDPYDQGWTITQDDATGDATPTGPSAPSNGLIFVHLHPDDNTLGVNATQDTGAIPTVTAVSMDVSFDFAGVGPVVANQAYLSVRLWNAADNEQHEVLKEFLVFDDSPTSFEHKAYHVNAPFAGDDGLPYSYSDVNRVKLTLNFRGLLGEETNIYIDNVVLALNTAPVPEPATLGLLAIGGSASHLRRRRMA